MISASDLTSKFALDVTSLEALKREARTDPDKALRSAAAQFEALLLQMMLKSMRAAADSGASTDSEDSKLYKSMLDQQLSIALAKRGIGLADPMVRQLARGGSAAVAEQAEPSVAPIAPFETPRARTVPRSSVPNAPAIGNPAVGNPHPTPRAAAPTDLPDTAREFVERLWPHALDASRATGIAPHFMIGQAALESGWGRGEIRLPDGSPSHNLFGIKAGRGWQGSVADVPTTEYVNGAPVKIVDRFRAYSSYAEAFKDYANLLASNPRYAQVLNERVDPAAFARSLQQAGYATDPSYADKLTRVITGAIMRTGLGG